MTLVLERGFQVRSALPKEGETLLEEWILVVERFCRLSRDDAPYWYTERANVGILAGAAWRCGWIALEEFQGEKSDRDLRCHVPEPRPPLRRLALALWPQYAPHRPCA